MADMGHYSRLGMQVARATAACTESMSLDYNALTAVNANAAQEQSRKQVAIRNAKLGPDELNQSCFHCCPALVLCLLGTLCLLGIREAGGQCHLHSVFEDLCKLVLLR